MRWEERGHDVMPGGEGNNTSKTKGQTRPTYNALCRRAGDERLQVAMGRNKPSWSNTEGVGRALPGMAQIHFRVAKGQCNTCRNPPTKGSALGVARFSPGTMQDAPALTYLAFPLSL